MVMVKVFGALTTVTTTSVRKAITIIFSFIIFPKPINSVYICGVVFVFFGIGMNIVIKQQQNDNRNRTSREKRSGSGGVEMV